MPKRKGISETKEDNIEQKSLNLNECAVSPDAELRIHSNGMEQADTLSGGNFSEFALKAERENDSLVDDGDVIEMKNTKTKKLKPIKCELFITQRVLRSGSVARDPAYGERHQRAVKRQENCSHKRDLSKGKNMGKSCARSSADEVKELGKEEIKVERKDDKTDDENGSFEPHGKEMQVTRRRGRPRKLPISSQPDDIVSISNCNFETSLDKKEKLVKDDSNEKFIGRCCFIEVKTKVKFDSGEYAEAETNLGVDSESQVQVEMKDDRSYDENGNIEPHDDTVLVKRKRGRPRKLQMSSQIDESYSETNSNLVKTPYLSSQSSVDRLSLKRRCGRPPKNNEAAAGLYIKKENVNCEIRRQTSNYEGKAKGTESDGCNGKGRKIVRKRGRPPKPQKKRNLGETDELDCNAKKRRELCENPLESRHNCPLIDGERRIGEQQDKQAEAGSQSRSESKKMLSDRILQLLLAAGWTVEFRPRKGRAYQDAVYLNPEGKTHWSITKAYQVYKKHLESSMNDQTNSTTSSGLGLLPEEDLRLLVRKSQKKRCDKGTQRPKWRNIGTNENRVSTKGIGKHTRHGKKVLKEKIRMQKKGRGSHESYNSENFSLSVRKIKREAKHNRKRCTPSARISLEDGESNGNGYILFEGKRTMLGWMIESTIVPVNGKVQCMDCKKTQVLLEGIVTKEGIRCNCCDEMFSVLDFEVHARGNCNQPFKSLYLEGGDSLLQRLRESLNKQSESQRKGFHFVDFGGEDPNDDTCGICGDGGDLICCDGCPSTFHQSCLDIKNFPSGAWFCCYCSCKFCEKADATNHDTATSPPLLSCRLCEEKYHQVCINQDVMVRDERSTDSFCGNHCQELFERLQSLIGVRHPLPEGFSWTFLRRFELPSEVSIGDLSEKVANNAKLAVAFSVMDECFSPLVDHRSGVNLLENIVYNFGSNFHRLNFSNFLTAVLERGDEIIAVASIRIHGNQLAEMPFVGTRYMYRRQGMCHRLMNGIEFALGSLKVDKLVIPAVPELIHTWTSGFGFMPVPESEKKAIKNLNLLVFPSVDMLEKSLVKEKIADSNMSSLNGSLPLAPEMSLPVDNEENIPDGSKDSAHERNCATADVQIPSYPVDSCIKSTTVEEGGKDTGSNLKVCSGDLDEEEEIEKLTDKDVESLPDIVDDFHGDQTDTKRQESGDLDDNAPLSADGCGGKTEESDQPPSFNRTATSQSLSNGGTGNEIVNKTLALKREVATTLRVSPRLSWRTSRVN